MSMKNNEVDPVLYAVWFIVWLVLVSVWIFGTWLARLVKKTIEVITDVQHTGE
jgi:hypothetical protein